MKKCVIIDKYSDCKKLEEAECIYDNGRLEKVLQCLDEYYIVSSDTPLGYVEDLEDYI